MADAIAVEAEGPADRGDETDAAASIGVAVFGGGGAGVGVRNLDEGGDLAR